MERSHFCVRMRLSGVVLGCCSSCSLSEKATEESTRTKLLRNKGGHYFLLEVVEGAGEFLNVLTAL